jgi:predicted ABC-type ATPase
MAGRAFAAVCGATKERSLKAMPVVTMIAGPNGSGKSTLIAKLRANNGLPGKYLNADDIALTLSGTLENVSRQAQEIVREGRRQALAEGSDYCFETVMSHPSHIEHMQDARNAGFETRLCFVATEGPIINRSRVANRVVHGGHDVPPERIEARYHRCLALLPAAIQACRHCLIFDNSEPDTPLRLLAEVERGRLRYSDSDILADLPFWWVKILVGQNADVSVRLGMPVGHMAE